MSRNRKIAAKMSEIVIEKGVPLPAPGARRARQSPLLGMAVGDSFETANLHLLRNAAGWGRQQFPQRKFAQRDVGGGSFRVWRIA